MPTPTSESFAQVAEQLRNEFRARLPERIADIGEQWSRLACAEWDREALTTLYRNVHSLIGSSGVFGFASLSLGARELETLLESVLEDGNRPDESVRMEIARRLGAIRAIAADAIHDRKPSPHMEKPDLPPAESGSSNVIIHLVSNLAHADDLNRQLSHFGYTLQPYTDLGQFCRAASLIRPLAVLADSEKLDELAASPLSSVPLVVLSDRSDFDSRLRAVRKGAVAFFQRPLDVSMLVERLDFLTSSDGGDPIRVLIVDDSREISDLLAAQLGDEGMRVITINNPMTVTASLAEFNPDVIVMDLHMPGCTGLELASVIRQQNEFVMVPIVYLSSETDPDLQMKAMRIGGDEFLNKPAELARLVAIIQHRARRARILRSFVLRDGLTGLLNHTAIEERLENEVARAGRLNSPLAYAIIDLDRFKLINDTYGHPTGDQVLKTLARVLLQRLRKTDVIGRYGGEEFAVILPNTTGPQAHRLLDELREQFGKMQHVAGGTEFFVTFSCGIAAFPEIGNHVLLNDSADRALYKAKNRGRNQAILAQDEV